LRFAARKLGIAAGIVIRRMAGESEGGAASDPGSGAGTALVLESTTHLPGRTFIAREVLDPATVAARQIVDTETGAKHHRKTYTLGSRGFELDLLQPDGLRQMVLPSERWTRETRSFTPYPPTLPAGATITGPAGLLLVVAAADLRAAGDSVTVYVLVQTQIERVTASVVEVVPVQLDLEEDSGLGGTAVHERRTVARLLVHGEPVDAAAASVFRLFGLEGDVTILWDPVRRLPVELAGQVHMLGDVEVRLVSVTR
jgi:hypothetical protein